MGKSRIKTRTSYFVVTTSGRLRKIRPTLIVLIGILLLAGVAFVGGRGYMYNRSLVQQKRQIEQELAQIQQKQFALSQDLAQCLEKKEKISSLLYWNTTDSGKITDEE